MWMMMKHKNNLTTQSLQKYRRQYVGEIGGYIAVNLTLA
jgi:hypothetical protein